MRVSSLTSRCLLAALLAVAAVAGAQQAQQSQPAQPAQAAPKEAASETPKILEGLPQGTYAWFKTNMGEFVAKLFTDIAPVSTANFIGLAEGTKMFIDPNTTQETKRPFYDGLTFHRIIPDFMIQGGDPLGTGIGGPGYQFKDEYTPTKKFDKPGILAMANSGPNTNGSQFFVTVKETPWLNDAQNGPRPVHYNIFGEVVKGMDNVLKISKVQTGPQDRPVEPVKMEKVRIYSVDASGKATEQKTPPAK